MSKNRAWKSLLFKVSHLDLEFQDRKELMDHNKVEFDKLVCKEVGIDFFKSKYGDPDNKDLVKSEDLSNEENQAENDSSEDNPSEEESLPEEDNQVSEDENKPKEKVPDSINKLWKAIALKTHPDRNQNNEEYTSIYIDASNAYKEKSYGKLLIIALDLGIKVVEDNELIPYIKDNINSLQEKIQHIETLALWQWLNAEDEEQKNLIIKFTAEIVKKRNLQQSI